MKYKIRTNIVEKICFFRGVLVTEEKEVLYLEKLLFSDEEIKLGYRIIDIDEDIEIYIYDKLEKVIDIGLKKYELEFPKNKEKPVFVPPRRFLEDPYVDFYDLVE